MNARRRVAKRKDFPVNLYQKADGYFWYRNPKTNKSKGLGHDRAHAFREARAANNALEQLPSLSLADWVTGKKSYTLVDWIVEYAPLWESRIKPSELTKRLATAHLKWVSEADFAKFDICAIDAQHIAMYIDEQTSRRGERSAEQIRSRLLDVFRQACAKGLIARNPVEVTYAPKSEVKRDRLTIEHFHAILNVAPQWLQNAMWLALLTGQRREDVTLMKFSDVRDGFLHVEQSKSQGKVKLRLDTNIRLAAAGKSIADIVRQCRDSVVSHYMVHYPVARRSGSISPNNLSDAFSTFRDKAAVKTTPGKTPSTFHEIRSLAERLYRKEYGAEFAQNMLGHKNAEMTARYDDLRGTAFQEIKAK